MLPPPIVHETRCVRVEPIELSQRISITFLHIDSPPPIGPWRAAAHDRVGRNLIISVCGETPEAALAACIHELDCLREAIAEALRAVGTQRELDDAHEPPLDAPAEES